jgi:hypothetical protein
LFALVGRIEEGWLGCDLTYVVAVVGPGDVESRADVDVRGEVFYLDLCVAEGPEEGCEGDAGRDVEEFHRSFVKLICWSTVEISE